MIRDDTNRVTMATIVTMVTIVTMATIVRIYPITPNGHLPKL